MKLIHPFIRHPSVSNRVTAAFLLAGLMVANAAPEERFATSDEAVKALTTAAANKDTNALETIFGPGVRELVSADPVQASNGLVNFSRRVSERVAPVTKSD